LSLILLQDEKDLEMCKAILNASTETHQHDPAVINHDKESFTAFLAKFAKQDPSVQLESFPRDSPEMVGLMLMI
jgi:hypothetical protein